MFSIIYKTKQVGLQNQNSKMNFVLILYAIWIFDEYLWLFTHKRTNPCLQYSFAKVRSEEEMFRNFSLPKQKKVNTSIITISYQLIVLGWTRFMGSKFGIFGGLGRVHSSSLVDKPRFEVRFCRSWSRIRPISGQTRSNFGLFGGVWKGSMFSFGGWTWGWVSSKFGLSSSKQFEFS